MKKLKTILLQRILSIILLLTFTPQLSAGRIHYAIQQGNFKRVKTCVYKDKETIQERIGHGAKPIHIACEKGSLEIVKFLLAMGETVDAKNNDKKTPLHLACLYGRLEIIKFLVENGANLEAKDWWGDTPLYIT